MASYIGASAEQEDADPILMAFAAEAAKGDPASPEARAARRWKEYQEKGVNTPYEEVLADVKQRDYQDTHRAAAPLKQAEDAVLLDTSELDFEQSLAAMKKIIAEKVKN